MNNKRIRAIETRYAGCRFRSRLEARWAVFFDHMGIQWEYEPEGFHTPDGPYLPDFWLPASQRWIEIKGAAPTENDLLRCAGVAATEWSDGHGFRILVGEIPRSPTQLPCAGTVVPWAQGAIPCLTWSSVPTEIPFAPDYVDIAIGQVVGVQGFIESFWVPANTSGLADALEAARSARFEHGERG